MIKQIEQDLIAQAASEHGVDPDLLRGLIDIRNQFPELEKWGCRLKFEKAIGNFVEAAAEMVEDGEIEVA